METSTFLKRALILQAELQNKRYPNASSLAEICGCSRSTAMRTIDRLRYEFGVPMDYDESERGYYLTRSDFSFASLPPGRDELVVMILLSELLSMIDDASLRAALTGLWARITNGRSDLSCDLDHLRARFSSETTSVAKLADTDLVRLLFLCHRGQPVSLVYRSPWRHEEDKSYIGIFQRLHFSDGILYAMFDEYRGRQIVFNVSFIKEVKELDQLPPKPEGVEAAPQVKPHWLEGFGVWSGAKPESVEITIAAPASRYFSAQTWHPEQEDSWDGDTLIRRFPSIPSPELNRRILSLGRYIISVKPESILEGLRGDVDQLQALVSKVAP
ncbi:MAG: helix-turn-helix transcriptional regulator [Pseudomonadota bacterium]|jgi:predicted DNA-binding transcriptional regulator YafY